MHIPDGFVDPKIAAASGVLAAAGLGIALRGVRRTLPASQVPLLGLAAAFVFAAQMLNFPVAGGTSGHLLGAVLTAVLLGPAAAVVVMSAVVILQCLMFADGGVTALGANIFNMALVAPGVGYAVYSLMACGGASLRRNLLATGFAAWFSTVVAAAVCAAQLALSRAAPLGIVLPAMMGIHMLIGIGEGAITTLVVAAVARIRPGLIFGADTAGGKHSYKHLVGGGLVVVAGLVLFMTPVASDLPDGLEQVAGRLGFENMALQEPVVGSPLPDYAVPWLAASTASTIVAGLAGAVAAFALAYLLARVLTPAGASPGRPEGGRRS